MKKVSDHPLSWWEVVSVDLQDGKYVSQYIRAETVDPLFDKNAILINHSIEQMYSYDTVIDRIVMDSFDATECMLPFLHSRMIFEPLNRETYKKIVDWSCGMVECNVDMNLHGGEFVRFKFGDMFYDFGRFVDDPKTITMKMHY